MRIAAITTACSRPSGQPAPGAEAAPAGESRALLALTPAAATYKPSDSHRQAAFLAHLIATKGQLPQTRERRRAAPPPAPAGDSARPPRGGRH